MVADYIIYCSILYYIYNTRFTLYYIMLYCVILCYIMLYYIILCYIMLYKYTQLYIHIQVKSYIYTYMCTCIYILYTCTIGAESFSSCKILRHRIRPLRFSSRKLPKASWRLWCRSIELEPQAMSVGVLWHIPWVICRGWLIISTKVYIC